MKKSISFVLPLILFVPLSGVGSCSWAREAKRSQSTSNVGPLELTTIRSIDDTIQMLITDLPTFMDNYGISTRSQSDSGPKIGIIGDSVSSGALASANMEATFFNLLLDQPLTKFNYNLGRYFSYKNPRQDGFDLPDYRLLSFGHIMAAILGTGQDQIINVAQDGRRISTMAPQLNELLNKMEDQFHARRLPEVVFSSYNANDMCSQDIFTQTAKSLEEDYRRQLRESYSAISQLPASRNGTDFFVLANLDVVQVLTDTNILMKNVNLSYGRYQCSDFRKPYLNQLPKFPFRWAVKKLMGMCPGILGTDVTDKEKVQHLSDIYNGYIRAQEEVAAEFQPLLEKQNIHLHFIKETSDIHFASLDLANDCFHPNYRGHLKIVTTLLQAQPALFQAIQTKHLNSKEARDESSRSFVEGTR